VTGGPAAAKGSADFVPTSRRTDRRQPLRVLFLTTSSYPDDSRIRAEVETLAAAGHLIVVACARAGARPSREHVDGVKILRFRNPFLPARARGSTETLRERTAVWYLLGWLAGTLALLILSFRVLRRPGFDIVHVHNPPDTLAPAASIFKLAGKRIVYDQHDLAPEMLLARRPGAASAVFHRGLLLLERLSCQAADRVIVTNESYRAIDIERNNVDPANVTIVRNGPSLDRFDGVQPDSALQREARPLIGYFGVIGPQDGVDLLLRTLDRLVHELGRVEVLCVIVGAGDAWPAVQKLATTLDLEHHTRFTGWVDEQEALGLLAACDVGVEPSPMNEYTDRSTMIKVMTYMALGKPVVGFELRENRYTAGEAGVFVPPNDTAALADAIAELLDDPERRAKLGEVGRVRVQQGLAWDKSAANLLAAYDRLD
jgi:glycosyltransferase involved in cell wall biosynthesis